MVNRHLWININMKLIICACFLIGVQCSAVEHGLLPLEMDLGVEKIDEFKNDIYVQTSRHLGLLDFRLAHINRPLLEELEVEGAILVDLTGMVRSEKYTGYYKYKVSSQSVSDIFEALLRRLHFDGRRYGVGKIISREYAASLTPVGFLSNRWKDIVILPGDIIVLEGAGHKDWPERLAEE